MIKNKTHDFKEGLMKKIGVLQFPGTNCDRDVFDALQTLSYKAHWLWHKDHFDPEHFDGFVVPGGFSFGDYLRPGVLAARSRAVQDLITAAKKQKPILGICNGFQILCEAKLLPGILLSNSGLRFIDKWVSLETISNSKFWKISQEKTPFHLPIAS